jgi:hypothetical protein
MNVRHVTIAQERFRTHAHELAADGITPAELLTAMTYELVSYLAQEAVSLRLAHQGVDDVAKQMHGQLDAFGLGEHP